MSCFALQIVDISYSNSIKVMQGHRWTKDRRIVIFFEREYLENFSSIENADGYLAIVNVETSQLHNQASISQSAFQFMMRLLNETMPKSQRVDQLNHDLHQAQLELDRMTQIAAAAQSRIQAMETSKFWKLRSTWFQFKRKLGLPTQE